MQPKHLLPATGKRIRIIFPGVIDREPGESYVGVVPQLRFVRLDRHQPVEDVRNQRGALPCHSGCIVLPPGKSSDGQKNISQYDGKGTNVPGSRRPAFPFICYRTFVHRAATVDPKPRECKTQDVVPKKISYTTYCGLC